MNIPKRYKAKGVDGNWYEGYYFQFPETTYCIKEDYERNPPEIIHGLVFHQMTDWGLPNDLKWVRIDPDTLTEINTNEKFGTSGDNAIVYKHAKCPLEECEEE